jgi:hypothetical protein
VAAVDQFANNQIAPDTNCRHAAAVTPSDTIDLGTVAQRLFVGGAGNLVVITVGGETVTFTGVTAGTQFALQVARVKATGTTATNIVALW